jgi:hypothetical protein
MEFFRFPSINRVVLVESTQDFDLLDSTSQPSRTSYGFSVQTQVCFNCNYQKRERAVRMLELAAIISLGFESTCDGRYFRQLWSDNEKKIDWFSTRLTVQR